MDDEKLVSAEEARGCGDGGCVFRAPSSKGQHTNAGCRCLPLRMTPAERVGLREQIRSLVVELDEARERANKAERERDEARAERDRLARERDDWHNRRCALWDALRDIKGHDYCARIEQEAADAAREGSDV